MNFLGKMSKKAYHRFPFLMVCETSLQRYILQEVRLISRREQWLGPQGPESDLILNPTTFC